MDKPKWSNASTGRMDLVTGQARGFRDVMWCPYANEPTFLAWEGNEPTCLECKGNFEPETHEFICHIGKP